MDILLKRLQETPQSEYIIGLFAISWISAMLISLSITFMIKNNKLDESKEDVDVEAYMDLLSKDTVIRFIEKCLITPYLETIVVQWVIFRLVALIFGYSLNSAIVSFYISTIVFAALHMIGTKWYSIIIHLPLSISLALVFMVNDITQTRPVLYTFLFHSIWNTMSIIVLPLIGNLIIFIRKKVRT